MKVTVNLDEELGAAVSDAVASGAYRSVQDVVREALWDRLITSELIEHRDREEGRSTDDLVNEAARRARKGEGVVIKDIDAYFDDVIRRGEERFAGAQARNSAAE